MGLVGKDPKDSRDYLLSDIQAPVELPEEYTLRDKMTPVETQDGLGICYAMAACAIGAYWEKKNLSERFVVHNTKTISGMWGLQGDYFRNAVKAYCDYGAPLETDYPNDFSLTWEQFSKNEPPIEVVNKALENRGGNYWRVDPTIENIKQAVFQNKAPVLIGMGWYGNYQPVDGKLPPADFTNQVGGHAVTCVGWTYKKLWFKNSWGAGWGDSGYFYIPFDEFDKYSLWDCWIVLDLEPQVLEGWVALKYLNAGFKTTTTDVLNVRATPNGTKIGQLSKGKELTVTEIGNTAGGYLWVKIKSI